MNGRDLGRLGFDGLFRIRRVLGVENHAVQVRSLHRVDAVGTGFASRLAGIADSFRPIAVHLVVPKRPRPTLEIQGDVARLLLRDFEIAPARSKDEENQVSHFQAHGVTPGKRLQEGVRDGELKRTYHKALLIANE